MIRDSCQWVIHGTKTFRLASRKIQKLYGGNLANIEKSARQVYVPDEGKVFVQTDQSGAEALIVAYLCEPASYRQLFIHGVKPHVYVAIHLFKDIWKRKAREYDIPSSLDIDGLCNTPIQALKSIAGWKELDRLIKDSDNWPSNERYYYLAKQTCHSANYGIEANTFRMNILEKSGGKIALSRDDAERFLLTYRSLFPEIVDWNQRVARQVRENRMLYNLFGHPFTITDLDTLVENKMKDYIAWIPQSTVGMITNIAFSGLQRYIEEKSLPWDNLINGHDSIVSQCPINQANECGKMQRQFIEQEFVSPFDGVKFNMRSECQIGLNWSPMKEGKNPLGLKEVKL